MNRHHQKTLQALFSHPLQHGVRAAKVEALLRQLGAEITKLSDSRLQIRLPQGGETWIHSGGGHHPDLDSEAVMRVRHFLQEAGISPAHPEGEAASARGDQSHRLVLHLNHHQTDVFSFDGKEVEQASLRPHGLWGSGENLSHRHDRDIAGQRAPRDNEYLARITAALAKADAVLLLGHGSGESDMRQVLLHYLENHHRELLDRIVGIETLNDDGLTDGELLALAREHFGNLPHRRPIRTPGQEVRAI